MKNTCFRTSAYSLQKRNKTAICYRSRNALPEVEEPEEMVNRSGQAPIATDVICLQG